MYCRIILTLSICLFSSVIFTQSIEGVWIFKDHKDGLAKSHVKIYQKENRLHGRIIKFLPDASITSCINCEGDLKGKSLLDMDVINDLTLINGKWYGKILDPEKNRKYSCQLSLKDPNTLKIRVYIAAVLFGKTIYWEKLN